MKIGQITLNGFYNYGNRLQNYALQTVLKQYARTVETIWHEPNNYLLEMKGWTIEEYVKYFINWKNRREYIKNVYLLDVIRQYKFKKFNDQYVNTKYDFSIKYDLAEQYDYFIVGSDQVWNPYFAGNDVDFLTFAPKEKRISYAASFGIPYIPKKEKKRFTRLIESMSHISVREKQGANIIYELTGRIVPVLVDPTMLLTNADWQSIASCPAWYTGQQYILIYFFGEIPSILQKNIDCLSKQYHLKIINLMDYRNIDWYVTSPSEFIYLVENASFICTDSFHGVVFSILSKIPFVVCDQQKQKTKSMISRIDNILDIFSFQNRKISEDNNYDIKNMMNLEYSNVESILVEERMKAHEYLENAINFKRILK